MKLFRKNSYESDKITQWDDFYLGNTQLFSNCMENMIRYSLENLKLNRNLDGSYRITQHKYFNDKKISELDVAAKVVDEYSNTPTLYFYSKLPRLKNWTLDFSMPMPLEFFGYIDNSIRLAELFQINIIRNYFSVNNNNRWDLDQENFERNLNQTSKGNRLRYYKSLTKKNPLRKKKNAKKIKKL